MKDLILAFGLLAIGFVALQKRATREPYDFRAELMADSQNSESLASALEKALKKKKSLDASNIKSDSE
jgi:hypothetical protein